MRVAVTGASGFIGRALMAALHAGGHDPVALSRSTGADYSDLGGLSRSFEGAAAVVHLAALAHRTGTDREFEANVTAARTAAQAAREAGAARFILMSSIGVNGNTTRDAPFTEASPEAPVEPYARSKRQAEQEVRSLLAGGSTDCVVLRPPLVYGPRAPGNFARLANAVARGWPLPFAGIRNQRSMVGIDNLVSAVLASLTHPAAANELFLVADGEDFSTPQIVSLMGQGLGRSPRLWPVPPSLLKAAAAAAGRSRMAQSLCDSLQVDASKMGRVLGWRPPVPAAAGIAAAAASWRSV